VAAAVLWAAPGFLRGQTASLTQQLPTGIGQPFSRLDDSLAKAADALLVSPEQITVPATANASVDEAPRAALALRVDLRSRLLLDGGSTLAAARLDLLRPILDPILRNRGVPTELAAVVLVESGGRSMALSPKGARGLWQLMPDTARRYGLRVDEVQDDRIDLFKATDAAARYLHDLYAQFGDWKLALAAYNTGEANVGSAILRAHTQDFDQLTNLRMLPLETRDYVPRVLATARLIGQPLTLGEVHPPVSEIVVFAVSNR
jgi:soluble lytic murein transglycosylase-like protein